MHQFLISNVTSSLARVAAEGLSPQSIRSSKPLRHRGLDEIAAAMHGPHFSMRSDGTATTSQLDRLGFFVLRNIMRGLLIGARPIEAGNLLIRERFYAASITMYYTGAFHLLLSLLALHGRLLVEGVSPETEEYQDNKELPDTILASLTKRNTWKIEGRQRSHVARWRELREIHILDRDPLRNIFLPFFTYLASYGPHGPDTEEQAFAQGLERLIESRHESIYHGSGFDDFAFDSLINDDFGGLALRVRAAAFRRFALRFVNHIAHEAFSMQQRITGETWKAVQPILLLSVLTPPFEIPGIPDLEGDPEFHAIQELRSLYAALFSI